MGIGTMHRWDLEDMAERSDEWRERAKMAELKIHAWGPRMWALEARCSELVVRL